MQLHFHKLTNQSTPTATEIERDRDMRWGSGEGKLGESKWVGYIQYADVQNIHIMLTWRENSTRVKLWASQFSYSVGS